MAVPMSDAKPDNQPNSDELVAEAMNVALEWLNIVGSNTADPAKQAQIIEEMESCAALRDEALTALDVSK